MITVGRIIRYLRQQHHMTQNSVRVGCMFFKIHTADIFIGWSLLLEQPWEHQDSNIPFST